MIADREWSHLATTRAEREILSLIADGAADREIADHLVLTVRGVRSRLQRFSDKSGLSGRRLVAWCVRHRYCCLLDANHSA